MILNDIQSFIGKWLLYQNTNLLFHIKYYDIISFLYKNENSMLIEKPFHYKIYKDVFLIDMKYKDITYDTLKVLLKSIISSNIETTKKKIIFLNIDETSSKIKNHIKSIIDKSFKTCIYLSFFTNYNKIEPNLRSRFLYIRHINLPITNVKLNSLYKSPISISLESIITLYKKPYYIKHFIKTIKELSYKYNSLYSDITPLQHELLSYICINNKLPNIIKYKIINEISTINHLYYNSYKKYLYLEYTIVAVYNCIKDYIDFL